ncbi:polygalacturonase [Dysgonomonas hofstadii]|uniref:Polygalacturonase n=1 Tax=Dysgonomonas hofstadii TaxID=637886 RepID=A0A840CJS0_9BACT|nr:glycosyl hydrolase family 28 protein [Dysgonomonas hofstadii]MBB4035421.1 polygalacturonase [Dysgonomonas hofstadii]
MMKTGNYILCLLLALAIPGLSFSQKGWDYVKEIEKNIKPPVFADKNYNIVHFGAEKGGVKDARTAINAAITQCSNDGGGRVTVPAGKYYIKGPVILKSNVNLHLSEGAELVFSSDEKDYLPAVLTRWEGTEVFNYSPLIYAYQVENIAITGKGLLNGQGSKNIATWKPNQKEDQKLIRKMGRDGVPVYERLFGEGHWLRQAFVEPVGCRNILIEGVKITDATFWVIHPVACDNVTVRDVVIDSFNPNSDGFDPESTTNALIEKCHFRTGDDGVAIKSGRDQDGWRIGQPTENIIVRDCTFESHANGVCIGSEISGGVRNVFIENVTIPKASNGIYFKSNLDRGGYIENVWARNIKIDSVKTAVKFDPDYKSESKENYPTRYRGFVIENVDCHYASHNALEINGFENMPVTDVTLKNVRVKNTRAAYEIQNARKVSLQNVVVNGKPVTHIEPEKTISLNGLWDVRLTDEKPDSYASKVPVPGILTMSSPLVAEGLHGNDLKDDVGYNYVWYHLDFDVNEEHYKSAILKIRAKYNALVFLNGKEIGYDHHCTYSHAEFDISNAINYQGSNELVVRVGSWNTASSPSKENSSEWWRNSRAPGLWDDVSIELGNSVGIKHIKVLPEINNRLTLCDVEIANKDNTNADLTVTASIFDGDFLVSNVTSKVKIGKNNNQVVSMKVPSEMLQYWTAGKEGTPKQYCMNVCVADAQGNIVSDKSTMFGYRNIEVQGKDVLLNGEKIMFRAENIAFVRALNRWQNVMFDETWIRNFLRTAVQDYNFNYLRIHLGHAYSKWYEIADQEGIMLQDEWRYMHDDEPVGKDLEEVGIEFRRWIKQNVNHPSIVTWDQENEGHVRLEDLKAELRKYDPTRLWGEDDFYAKHVYDYSEQVISAPFFQQATDCPSTILESCRLWTNEFGLLEPREDYKTSRTSTGWGVFYYDSNIIGQLLADLHADIGTYYRKTRLQAWAPFALLSGWVNGQNFLLGNIADSLTVQQNLQLSLTRLNEPVGVSVDMLQCQEWYNQKTIYKPGASYTKDVVAWNDFGTDAKVNVVLKIKSIDGEEVSSQQSALLIPKYESSGVQMKFIAPNGNGCYILEPTLILEDGSVITGPQRRILVAKNMDKELEGYMAFGGRRTPIEGGESCIRNFLKFDPPAKVVETIIKVAEGNLLDRLSLTDNIYTMQSTSYKNINEFTITTTKIDNTGKILFTEKANAMNYVDLPKGTRDIIAELIGAVPVDESRIIVRKNEGYTNYDVRLNESAIRCKLSINDDGTVRDKKVIKQ